MLLHAVVFAVCACAGWAQPMTPFSFSLGGEPSSAVLARSVASNFTVVIDAARTLTSTSWYDAATGLIVHLNATVYVGLASDSSIDARVSATEFLLAFSVAANATGPTPLVCNISPLNATLADSGSAPVTATVVHRHAGSCFSEDDFSSIETPLSAGGIDAFHTSGGRSSDCELPFFTVVAGAAGRTVSIGWSGSWGASIARGVGASSTVTVAHSSSDGTGVGVCAALLPSESFRSMSLVVIDFPADTPSAHHFGRNLHRRLLTAYKLPRDAAGAVHGALVSMSYVTVHCPQWSIDLQMALIDTIKATGAGIEAYWLDADWFKACFPTVGDWQLPISAVVNPVAYPNASFFTLGPLAHAAPVPLKFVLWTEPERVSAGTFIAQTHPEFTLSLPGNDQHLFNIGLPAAAEYMTAFLTELVAATGQDVLRLDFNIAPGPYWEAADEPGRAGITELKHISALYAMWDSVLASHPGLLIDNCASGGRRIDLETLSRSVPLWRSDYSNPSAPVAIINQVQTLGLSTFAPISSGFCMQWDPYTWRSAGMVGHACAPPPVSSPDLPHLQAGMTELLRVRPVAVHGDFFPLTPAVFNDNSWAAWQHHCPGNGSGTNPACGTAGSGAIVVFRRQAASSSTFAPTPFDLEPSALYNVSYYFTYELDHTDVVTGAALTEVVVTLSPASSLLLEYTAL